MFEVAISRGWLKWKWRVCDRQGNVILSGFEKTRVAAKYAGERALFFILLIRPDIIEPPQTPKGPQPAR